MKGVKKVGEVLRGELGWLLWPRFILMHMLLGLLPSGTSARLRAMVYRAFGWRFGPRTLLLGTLTFSAPEKARANLSVGEGAVINAFVHIDATAPVEIGAGVGIGHHVVIITAGHEIGPPEFRAGPMVPQPVVIGPGAWISARVTILPGVRIGAGAVVTAGSVVRRDVPDNTVVAGVPARVARELTANELRLVNAD